MIQQNKNTLTTRVADTKNFTFNFPDKGDRVILIHNPFNTYDSSSIVVLNKQLQQIGHLTPHGVFNKKIGNLIKWQPYVADVIEVYPNFTEVFIEISIL